MKNSAEVKNLFSNDFTVSAIFFDASSVTFWSKKTEFFLLKKSMKGVSQFYFHSYPQ